LSSLSDLKDLPHVLHTKDWAILVGGLFVSPLSGVGPMLDADILLLLIHFAALSNLSVIKKEKKRRRL
jgi:hypothetical protein